ncbi:MAG: hypothetical protein ACR2L2_08615 [Acidobacteriota bacterium]
MMEAQDVPVWLRRWFIVHFAVDLFVAVPLFVAPHPVLGLLGWIEIDPAMSRVVAAALFAIGIQSLLGRNEPRSTFLAMLTLKLIWSAFAIAGILISVLQGAPPVAWGFLGVFAAFSVVWWWYWLLLRRRRGVSA